MSARTAWLRTEHRSAVVCPTCADAQAAEQRAMRAGLAIRHESCPECRAAAGQKPEPLTGRMHCVCSRCGDRYGDKPCVLSQDGAETHGYCPACAPGVQAEFEAEMARAGAAETLDRASHGAQGDPATGRLQPHETAARSSCVYLPGADVAAACGVPLAELHGTYRPKRWRMGEHWIEPMGVVLYREAYVHELVASLATHQRSRVAAARALWAWLVSIATKDSPAAQPGATPEAEALPAGRTSAGPARQALSPEKRGWAAEWEDRHDA